ncbi:MAG: hypothetical protein QOE68_1185 [Thermoanaerobaculia bacterium]|jgi:hypothetical protein|nr:hypothetical protein [Thermoanaerobaculia bacterium]
MAKFIVVYDVKEIRQVEIDAATAEAARLAFDGLSEGEVIGGKLADRTAKVFDVVEDEGPTA